MSREYSGRYRGASLRSCDLETISSFALSTRRVCYISAFARHPVVCCAGMRGAEVPGRGLSPVDELRRQVPLDLPDQEVAAAAARNRLSAAGIEAARNVAAHSRGPRFLHRQFHHSGRSLGK